MSHRKNRSEGYVPFSWEEKPGVPKSSHQKSSSDVGLKTDINFCSRLIPPPPPPRKRYSGASGGKGGLLWEDDPFLAAFKSCTQIDTPVIRRGQYEELRQKSNNVWSSTTRKSGSAGVFSCKLSCNVENGNVVKLSKLPPLPKQRYNAKSLVKNKLQPLQSHNVR